MPELDSTTILKHKECLRKACVDSRVSLKLYFDRQAEQIIEEKTVKKVDKGI